MSRKPLLLFVLLFIPLVWLFAATPPVQPLQIAIEPFQKVVAPPDWTAVNYSGIQKLHDYGSFALYAVSQSTASQLNLSQDGSVQIVDEWDNLWVGNTPLNTQLPPQTLTSNAPDDQQSAGAALHLVQFVGPIKQEWLTAVTNTGATLIHYVANNGYLVWADEASRAQLAQLRQAGDFLQYSAPYATDYKIEAELESVQNKAMADEIITVAVQMIRHEQQTQTEQIIQSLSLLSQVVWTPVLKYQNSVVTVHPQDIAAIAALPDVVWVGAYHTPEMLDEVQGQILAGALNTAKTGPTGPGYLSWLDTLGFSQNPADYPIIDIVDDGVGIGEINSGDYTLHEFGNIANPSRVAYISNCTADADGGGIHGHGHINASIATGYDTQSGFPFRDSNGYQLGLGINPYGRLASTRIFSDAGLFDVSGCQNSVVEIARRTSASGAAISSNSWGCATCSGVYDLFSQAYDTAVRDAQLQLPGNQETIYIFGAGNSGPGSVTILSPGNGKNVITVGGSENYRPEFTDGCGATPDFADNAMDIAAFSSRGPAAGGRIKPEVVAPATHVTGTASPHPDYNGSAVCGYYPDGQTIFVASTGTSHATPAVSGVASLYTYWLENEYGITPSPAMMKAYLIAHPTYLTGQDADDTLPSNNQGFGMPNMQLGFDDTARYLLDQTAVFDNSGETWNFTTSVADPTKPVRLVMAYTDQPGMVGTAPQVNDLSIQIELNGQTYWGNNFNGQWSIPGGSPDALNNYEAIFLPAGTSGTFAVTITAFNVAGNGVPGYGDDTDQDFAFVCYNCTKEPDFHLATNPVDQSVCQTTNQVTYTINTLQVGNFSEQLSLSLQNLPAGASANILPITIMPGASSVVTLSGLNQVAAGDYKMSVTGTAVSQSHSSDLWLHVAGTPPPPITLTTPPDQAVDVVVNPFFSWMANPGTEQYTLQVATNATFTNIVYEATVYGYTHRFDSSLTRLEKDTLYYWRVTSQNSCGQSISPVNQFRTSKTLTVLLVDDDWGSILSFFTLGRNVETAYLTALNHQGAYYEYWNVESFNGLEPDEAVLSQYDAIIWFSGDAYRFFGFGQPLAGPNQQSELALAAYLDNGNCLLLSSQDYFYDRGITSFMQTYLGVESAENDAGAMILTGRPPFEMIGSFPINGTPILGLADPDIIYPNATATTAFVREDQAPMATYRDDIYQTLFLGFDLFDIEPTPRMLVIDRFLDLCRSVKEFAPPPPGLSDLYLPLVVK